MAEEINDQFDDQIKLLVHRATKIFKKQVRGVKDKLPEDDQLVAKEIYEQMQTLIKWNREGSKATMGQIMDTCEIFCGHNSQVVEFRRYRCDACFDYPNSSMEYMHRHITASTHGREGLRLALRGHCICERCFTEMQSNATNGVAACPVCKLSIQVDEMGEVPLPDDMRWAMRQREIFMDLIMALGLVKCGEFSEYVFGLLPKKSALFTKEPVLQSHMCVVCDAVYSDIALFRIHVKECHGKPRVYRKCPGKHCQYASPNSHEIEVHQGVRANRRGQTVNNCPFIRPGTIKYVQLLTCDKCNLQFSTRSNIDRHGKKKCGTCKRRQRRQRPLQCQHCLAEVTDPTHEQWRYQRMCTQCGMFCPTVEEKERHLNTCIVYRLINFGPNRQERGNYKLILVCV